MPALPSFMDANPALELEVSSTDRQVDLVREGFDCVLRLGPIGDETLIARPLGRLRMVNAGSPAYLKALGGPLPGIAFCPTGGVSVQNAGDYLRLPNVACVGGSWVAPEAMMRAGDWAGIEALARAAALLRS